MKKEAAKTEISRGRRREQVGYVHSSAMNKTITVHVERRVTHPKYKKFVKRTTSFKAHDEKNEAKKGDKVLIFETRPLSKTKRWKLAQVIERADAAVVGE